MRYRCGAITEPGAVVRAGLPCWLEPVVPVAVMVLRVAAHRWIAAGAGCDCDAALELDPPAQDPTSLRCLGAGSSRAPRIIGR